MNKDQREIQRKLRILRHADKIGHVARTCRYFGIGRASFYRWREAYRKHGEAGLINRPTIPKQHYNRTPSGRFDRPLQGGVDIEDTFFKAILIVANMQHLQQWGKKKSWKN